LAAVVGAHADATISGLIESAYYTNSVGKGLTTGQNGGSEVRFGGSEDLGSGLKASFQYTLIGTVNAEGTSAGAVTSYNSFIGLSGDFGSLKLGNQFSPIFLAAAGTTAWGLSANSNSNTNPANGGGVTTGGVRLDNSMNYSSPSISGFTLAAQGNGDGSNVGYSLTYANGGLTAAYGYNKQTSSGEMNLIGLAYDAGVVKLFANSLTGYIGSSNRSASEVGVSVPFGAATLVASTSSSNASSTQTASNIGVKYDLSKRTQVYYLNTVNGVANTTSGLAAGSVTNIVGVQHAF